MNRPNEIEKTNRLQARTGKQSEARRRDASKLPGAKTGNQKDTRGLTGEISDLPNPIVDQHLN
jgi:hypothetical protein